MLDFNYNKKKIFIWFSIIWMLYIFLLTIINGYLSWYLIVIVASLSSFQLSIGYFNYTYLVPRFLFLKKISKYFTYLLFLFFTYVVFVLFIFQLNPHNISEVQTSFSVESNSILNILKPLLSDELVLLFGLIILFSTTLKIIESYKNKEKEAAENEKDKLKIQLKFLKSQINPHFLFNSLNNIYSLVVQRSSYAEKQILMLSELLRYLIYDAEKEKVELHQEVSYIENYIEMELLKDENNRSKISFNRFVNDSVSIEPMLLIPLVENAFKHGDLYSFENSFIKINLDFDNGLLDFSVVNSYSSRTQSKNEEYSGVGIRNIQERLLILYKESSDFEIVCNDHEYRVCLKINFNGKKI